MNKLRAEPCMTLQWYLMTISGIALTGTALWIFIATIDLLSDTVWIRVVIVAVLDVFGMLAFGYFGIFILFQESGINGIYVCSKCKSELESNLFGECLIEELCEPDSWHVIYDVSQCPSSGACLLSKLCSFNAEYTFWYSVAYSCGYFVVLVMTSTIVFSKFIPSLFAQAKERSLIV